MSNQPFTFDQLTQLTGAIYEEFLNESSYINPIKDLLDPDFISERVDTHADQMFEGYKYVEAENQIVMRIVRLNLIDLLRTLLGELYDRNNPMFKEI